MSPDFPASVAPTLVEALRDACAAVPDRVFLRFPERELTFGALRATAACIAAGLRALAVGPGDRVATLLDNCPEAVETWFGVNHAGAILVPINTANRGSFLAHQLNDSGATVLVVGAEHLDRVAPIHEDLSTVRHIVVVGQHPEAGVPVLPFASLLEHGAIAAHAVAGSDLAALLYTSGTTGASKGCMVSHAYLLHAGFSVVTSIQRQREDVQYSCLPLFHMHAISGTVVATLILQGTSVIGRKFSVSRFWDDIEASGASIAYIIGPMAKLLADAPDTDASLRCRGQLQLVRGAPFPPEAMRVWRDRFGVPEARAGGYGMTESAPVVTMPRAAEAPEGSSGRAGHGFELRIVDEQGAEVPAGQFGEVIVRPLLPHIMFEGYWNRPDATAERWSGDWFRTGDLGSIDAQGWFTFGDRLKDCMRRRGENISSVEVEAVVLSHPSVADVAVHAVPSPLTEDDVKVTVVAKAGENVDPAALWEWICPRVPDFAKPRYVEVRAELPRNSVGRILKFQLREEGVTPDTWDAERQAVPARG